MPLEEYFRTDTTNKLIDWEMVQDTNAALGDVDNLTQEELDQAEQDYKDVEEYVNALRQKLYNSDLTREEIIQMYAEIWQYQQDDKDGTYHKNIDKAIEDIQQITQKYTNMPTSEILTIIDSYDEWNHADIDEAFEKVHGIKGSEIRKIMLNAFVKKEDKYFKEDDLRKQFEQEQKEASTLNKLRNKFKQPKNKPPKSF